MKDVDQMRAALAQLTLQHFNQSRDLERMTHDIDVLQAAIDGYTKGSTKEANNGLDKGSELQGS